MADRKWFFIESVDTGDWEMWPVMEEAKETDADIVVGMTLSVRSRQVRSIKGEWIVRFVPDEKQQGVLNLLDSIDHYADSSAVYKIEDLVQEAIEADRKTRTIRRKQTHAA